MQPCPSLGLLRNIGKRVLETSLWCRRLIKSNESSLPDLRDGAPDVAQGQLAQEVLHVLQVPPAARPQPPEGTDGTRCAFVSIKQMAEQNRNL